MIIFQNEERGETGDGSCTEYYYFGLPCFIFNCYRCIWLGSQRRKPFLFLEWREVGQGGRAGLCCDGWRRASDVGVVSVLFYIFFQSSALISLGSRSRGFNLKVYCGCRGPGLLLP